jgi:hypothetical protein
MPGLYQSISEGGETGDTKDREFISASLGVANLTTEI